MFSAELLINAVAAGLLLGGFYAAVALGLSITFGQLDIVNIAPLTFVIFGSYVAFVVNESFGLDPILTGIVFMPVFFSSAWPCIGFITTASSARGRNRSAVSPSFSA